MNIQNLGSQEKLRVKLKDGISAEFCLKLWFEHDWYFAILLSQDGFESNCPEAKLHTITSQIQFEKVTIPEVHCRILDSYS